MPERTPYLAANWKMHKTTEETERFLADFLPRVPDSGGAEVVVCPPFASLQTAVEHCFQSRVRVAAQNMHEADEGAFTGEVSAPMLVDLGVDGVIVGHSERRQHFGESDELVNRKARAVLGAGMRPIVCVGETLDQREAGQTAEVVQGQVRGSLAGLPAEQVAGLVVAYEPVWAIGTGRAATAEDAQETIALVRGTVAELAGQGAADELRIQYGGSVKAGNAEELAAKPDIDGALVGGASLDADELALIVKGSARHAR
jgi:triosephosphate isomerase (TIM)